MRVMFFYGTLMRELSRAFMLKECEFLGLGVASGRLFDVGEFPALQQGAGRVLGELFQVPDQIVEKIDLLEGFDKNNPADSIFQRQPTMVKSISSSQTIQAEVYYYSDSLTDALLIFGGDYRRYIGMDGVG